jgi:hypothetical protein
MATREAEIVEGPTALARLDPQSLIAMAIEQKAPLEYLERLVSLAERVQAISAKQAYDKAMSAFQVECPPIYKTGRAKIVTRGGGSYGYAFAPLDEITSAISPVMGKFGLSFRWRVPSAEECTAAGIKAGPDLVAIICRITHELGHYEESGIISMPVEKTQEGGSGANPLQRVGIALTYAKRYSLMVAIGRSPEPEDTDGRQAGTSQAPPVDQDPHGTPQAVEGQIISEAQTKRFWAIARGTKWSDEQVHALLSEAGIMSGQPKDILVVEYEKLVDRLKKGPPQS